MHENGPAASGFLYFIAAIKRARDFLLARCNLISRLARAIIAQPPSPANPPSSRAARRFARYVALMAIIRTVLNTFLKLPTCNCRNSIVESLLLSVFPLEGLMVVGGETALEGIRCTIITIAIAFLYFSFCCFRTCAK